MIYRYKVVSPDRKSKVVETKKYCKKYEKDTIVKAVKNSLGIFCFETLRDAQYYRWQNELILKVRVIGRGKKPKTIGDVNFLHSFYLKKVGRNCNLPHGTICYPAVKVLE